MEQVVLVDEFDNPVGLMEKMEAHKKGVLHRAFSLLIYNSKGELMIQKRAQHKYHSPNLWTNTCCSHPRPNESLLKAAERRAYEELGLLCAPQYGFSFIYKTEFSNGLVEYELDHVLTAVYEGDVEINEEEASDWKFISMYDLKLDVELNPDNYTYWFKVILEHPNFDQLTTRYQQLAG